MKRLLSGAFLCLAALSAQNPAPQSQAAPVKLTGVPHKDQVDGLVRAFRATAAANGALGDGKARTTAMVLAAAGQCHRFYHAGDGPWTRNALRFLFERRGNDGLYRDDAGQGKEKETDDQAKVTTQWVISALEAMDPQRYAHDIAEASRRVGEPASAFAHLTMALEQHHNPVAYGKELAHKASQGLVTSSRNDGSVDYAASALLLAELTALQAAARRADAAANPKPAKAAPAPAPWSKSQQQGLDFLQKQQKDGVFHVKTPGGEFPSVELTALALAAAQSKPVASRSEAETAMIQKGLEWLLANQNKGDGSFGQNTLNYTTSAAIAALSAAADPRFKEALANAQKFLLGIQLTEQKGFERSDRDYGSIGYGGSERGDLSNLQFALEALGSSGLAPEHDAYAKALTFLQRTQNLKEVNDFKARTRNLDEGGEWQTMTSGEDGGAAYFPGNSPMGYVELPDGSKHPRSYGSMTYALLKAYTLCGIGKDDPRVRAAVQWIASNWSLEQNPGADPKLGAKTPYQGLYYYYMVMAQALDIAGIDQLKVGDNSLDWRGALSEHLAKTQRPDGSWLNEKNDRWWESQPLLCTIYCMLALQRCSK